MRILPPPLSPEGYEAPAHELNEDVGQLHLMGEDEAFSLEELKLGTETLILSCSLVPIPLEKREIRVGLTTEGQQLHDALLYDSPALFYGEERDILASQWQAIALHYQGVGWSVYEGENTDFQGLETPLGQIVLQEPLYIKPFKVETNHYHERIRTLDDGRQFISPPGVFDARLLRGYGGYYVPGSKLEDIQQIYYALSSTHDQTRAQLFSSHFLGENHTPPPLGGRHRNFQVIFDSPPCEEEFLNLAGALSSGHAKLRLLTGEIEVTLLSFHAELTFGHPARVNVYFRP